MIKKLCTREFNDVFVNDTNVGYTVDITKTNIKIIQTSILVKGN